MVGIKLIYNTVVHTGFIFLGAYLGKKIIDKMIIKKGNDPKLVYNKYCMNCGPAFGDSNVRYKDK